jgi:hypothetical protein
VIKSRAYQFFDLMIVHSNYGVEPEIKNFDVRILIMMKSIKHQNFLTSVF